MKTSVSKGIELIVEELVPVGPLLKELVQPIILTKSDCISWAIVGHRGLLILYAKNNFVIYIYFGFESYVAFGRKR